MLVVTVDKNGFALTENIIVQFSFSFLHPLELYKKMLAEKPEMYLFASGGVSSIQDIEQLHEAAVPAVITGKAIYEGKIKLDEITRLIIKN